jgi:hypothetical protein
LGIKVTARPREVQPTVLPPLQSEFPALAPTE